MGLSKQDLKLSKLMSYALRHHPEEFKLDPDDEGWCDLEGFLTSLSRHVGRELTPADLERIMNGSDKKRLEVKDGKIRASYGHSYAKKVKREPSCPPDVLYHGTSMKTWETHIRTEGLLPMGRQYVHLSVDEETALRVGRRHGKDVVVLCVDAKAAYEGGVQFYPSNDTTWLSDPVDARYVIDVKRV